RVDAAVAEQVDEAAGMLLAGDEQHLADADPLQELKRVVDHRPAPDREQVLVRDARQLGEPGRAPAGTDQALHRALIIALGRNGPRGLPRARRPALPRP